MVKGKKWEGRASLLTGGLARGRGVGKMSKGTPFPLGVHSSARRGARFLLGVSLPPREDGRFFFFFFFFGGGGWWVRVLPPRGECSVPPWGAGVSHHLPRRGAIPSWGAGCPSPRTGSPSPPSRGEVRLFPWGGPHLQRRRGPIPCWAPFLLGEVCPPHQNGCPSSWGPGPNGGGTLLGESGALWQLRRAREPETHWMSGKFLKCGRS